MEWDPWPCYENGSPMGYKSCERCSERTPYPYLNYTHTTDIRLMCPTCVYVVEQQDAQAKRTSGMSQGMWTDERALIEGLISLARTRIQYSETFLAAWHLHAYGNSEEPLTEEAAEKALDWLKDRLEGAAK